MTTLIEQAHREYYRSVDWRHDVTYLGVPLLKDPRDLWVEQELIYRTRPNVIIETGTAYGGSALFYSNLFDQLGYSGLVVSIDSGKNTYVPADYKRPVRQGIIYLGGDSAGLDTFSTAIACIHGRFPYPRIMVVLDSDHHAEHVYQELKLWAPLVMVGGHCVVEDTNAFIVARDEYPEGGPPAAIQRFLRETTVFQVDEAMNKFGLTFNTGGYLKRVR